MGWHFSSTALLLTKEKFYYQTLQEIAESLKTLIVDYASLWVKMENKKAMAPKKFEENESNPMNSAFCNSTNVQASKNL